MKDMLHIIPFSIQYPQCSITLPKEHQILSVYYKNNQFMIDIMSSGLYIETKKLNLTVTQSYRSITLEDKTFYIGDVQFPAFDPSSVFHIFGRYE